MPHVLWSLSGTNRLVANEFDSHEKALAAAIAIKGLAKVEPGIGDKWHVRTVAADVPGTMTSAQYQAFVADLVNFMDYMAEPTKNQRISLGIAVMLYLGVLFVLVYCPEARLLEGRALALLHLRHRAGRGHELPPSRIAAALREPP